MAYWLKLIGTIDEQVDEYSEVYVDYSAHGFNYILDGDKIILYATGRGMVFASADVISEPRPSGTNWPYRVDIRYRRGPLMVAEGIHVNEIADSEHETLSQELRHESFIPISEDEFNRAETLLNSS